MKIDESTEARDTYMSEIESLEKQIDSSGWLVCSSKFSKVFSPNFDDRPDNLEPTIVVIHNISLPLGNFGGKNVENLFLNKLDTSRSEFRKLNSLKVSSHFFVKRTGHIVQFVSTYKRAWHAGNSSFMGITSCNDFSIGIELEGSDFVSFEEKQYQSLFFLCQALAKKFPLLSAITSHEFIAPKRKTDPGPFFDWKSLERNLRVLSICWKIFHKKN
tara:strand:- start:1250 stop:1897 length:648 start_codon:yes stop_codon:yes gene_type:complete